MSTIQTRGISTIKQLPIHEWLLRPPDTAPISNTIGEEDSMQVRPVTAIKDEAGSKDSMTCGMISIAKNIKEKYFTPLLQTQKTSQY